MKLLRPTSAYLEARIITRQSELLDYTGHIIRGLSRDDARIILNDIQRLRELRGWKPLDMSGRWKRVARYGD